MATVWPEPAVADGRAYAACRSAGPYPLGVAAAEGTPFASTRTHEWQRASGPPTGHTWAWRTPCAEIALDAGSSDETDGAPSQAAASIASTTGILLERMWWALAVKSCKMGGWTADYDG